MDSRSRTRRIRFYRDATRKHHILSTYDKSYVNHFAPVRRVGKQGIFSIWSDFLRSEPQAFLSLYIHIPFCKTAKCFYCMYNSRVPAHPLELDMYLDTLEKDIRFFGPLFRRHAFTTLYVGGGTPSLLSEKQLARLFALVFGNFTFKKEGPGTKCLEVSPSTVTQGKIALAKAAGINRISMGVQSLDEGVLRAGRRAYVPLDRLKKIIAYIRRASFVDFNVDLLAGLPCDTVDKFLASFRKIAAAGVPGITVYFYRHEPMMAARNPGIAKAGAYRDYRSPYSRKELLVAVRGVMEKYGYSSEAALNEKKEYHVFRGQGRADLLHHPTEFHRLLRNSTFGLGAFSNSFIVNKSSYFQDRFSVVSKDGAYLLKIFPKAYQMRQYVLRELERSGRLSLDEFKKDFKRDFCDVFASEVGCLRRLNKMKIQGGQAIFLAQDIFDFSVHSKFFYDQEILERAVRSKLALHG